MKNGKRNVLMFLLILLLASCAVFAGGVKEEAKTDTVVKETRVWRDDLDRDVTVNVDLERLSPSGNLAQMMLYALCPEKMVGLARPLSDNAMKMMLPEIKSLPSFGNLFADGGNLNKEALIMARPEVLLDVGEVKPHMKEDFDRLQAQTGIPFVFIEGRLENTGDTIRELGRLVSLEERAEVLAEYADKTISTALEKKEKITEPLTAYYSSSPDGLNGFPSGSFHGEMLEFIGLENIVPASFSDGGNQISIEQMMLWDPDVMLIQNEDAYKTITTDPLWAGLSAVKNGRVYLIPIIPYPFLSNPPALNRLIGVYWLGTVCWPELWSDIDLKSEMKTFYDLFYHYTLTDEEIENVLMRI